MVLFFPLLKYFLIGILDSRAKNFSIIGLVLCNLMKIIDLYSTWHFFQTEIIFCFDRSHYTKKVCYSAGQTQRCTKVCLCLDAFLQGCTSRAGRTARRGAGLMVGFHDNKVFSNLSDAVIVCTRCS